jgi:hypothetical protein
VVLPPRKAAVAPEVPAVAGEAHRTEARTRTEMAAMEERAMREMRPMEERPVHEMCAAEEEWPINEHPAAHDESWLLDHDDRPDVVPADEVLADQRGTVGHMTGAAAVVCLRTQLHRLGGLTERYSTRRNGKRCRRAGEDRGGRERRNET